MSSPRRPADSPRSQPKGEDRLFRDAMARLGRVPNKDRDLAAGSPAPTAPVEGRLDLHGCSAAEALELLESFVIEAHVAGLERVLVITGKGKGSPRGVGVLRREVSSWLRRRGRRWVRAHAPAPPRLGGDGALVVELRR